MTRSRYFLSEYLLGIIVMMKFVGFRAGQGVLGKPLLPIAAPVKVAAGRTLSIHLFHKPLFPFFTTSINGEIALVLCYVVVMASTIVTNAILGLFTEHRKGACRKILARRLVRAAATDALGVMCFPLQFRLRVEISSNW